MKLKLKLRFLELVTQTTFHGVVKLFKSKDLLQTLVWFCVILSSYTYCSIYISSLIFGYLEYQVVTNIKTVYESQPLFPAVTICNAYPPVSCIFNAKVCEPTFLQNYARGCYSFNRGLNLRTLHPTKILNSKESGYTYGLSLILNRNSYYDIEILIHNQSIPYDYKKRIRISKGMETTLVVSRTFEHKLSKPFSNCKIQLEFEPGRYAATNQTTFPYFQSQCFTTCRQKEIAKACNMTRDYLEKSQYYYTNYNYYSDYYDDLFNNCSFLITQSVINRFLEEGENSICNCPDQCNSVKYLVSSFYLNTYSPNRESKINIFYEEFEYKLITQIPKINSDSLFGSIGGILGLFLGTSILSFFEIIDLIYCLLSVVLRKKLKKIKNKVST